MAHGHWYNAVSGYALALCKTLARNGHHVTLSLYQNTIFYEKVAGIENMGIELFILNPSNRILDVMPSIFRLKRHVREKNIQTVFVMTSNAVWRAYLLHKSMSSLRFIRFRGDYSTPKNNRLNRMLHRKPFIQTVVYPSKAAKTLATRNLRIIAPSIIVRYPEIAKKSSYRVHLKADRKRWNLPENDRIFAYVGRNQPVKGVDLLLEAFNKLENKNTFLLLLIKDLAEFPEETKKHREFVRKHKLEKRVSIHGFVENLPEILTLVDAGVISSTGSEVICRTVPEFFSVGVPVLSFPVNALVEYIDHGYNGLLCSTVGVESLKETIERFLQFDPITHSNLKRAAKETYEKHYSADSFYKAIKPLL